MKMQMRLGKPEPWVWWVTLVCLVLGGLLASLLSTSMRTNAEIDQVNASDMSREQLALRYAQAMRENNDMQKEVEKLRSEKTTLIDGAANDQKLRVALSKEIDDLRVRAGATAVEGFGIKIVIDDSQVMKNPGSDVSTNALLTHDVDLLQLINELRSAGAEAIEINGQRVASSTAIRCVGPSILVNNKQISAPFIVKAIGKPETLYGAVTLPYGILDQLKQLGMKVETTKHEKEKLRVPALTVQPTLEYGKPVVDTPSTR
jgi:uncharacterized protein YlxW (UPF0749 family)